MHLLFYASHKSLKMQLKLLAVIARLIYYTFETETA